MNIKKLKKQIERLCEMQYRKGFQHGFIACIEHKLTLKKVNKFRSDGYEQGYQKSICPITKRKVSITDETWCMPNMEDLDELLNK